MVQRLKALAARSEDQDLTPSTHVAAQKSSVTPVTGDLVPSSGSACTWHTDINPRKTSTHIK